MKFLRRDRSKSSLTYSKIRELMNEYSSIDKSVLRRVFSAWKNATAIDLPFSLVRKFIVRAQEINRKLEDAVNEIKESFFEGIFTIRAFRQIYGTGKSQIARFLYYKLREQFDAICVYEVVESENFDILKKKISDILERDPEKPKIVFIDEVDLLINSKLSESEQVRLLEEFANMVILLSEKAKAKEVPLALILIVSAKVDNIINNFARDRFGRRLLNTLVEADIMIEESDLENLGAIIFALLWNLNISNIQEKVSDKISNFVDLMNQFIKDLASKFYDPAKFKSISIGLIISDLLNALNIVFRYIRRDEWILDAHKILADDRSYLGRRIELLIKEYIKRGLSYLPFKIADAEIEVRFHEEPLKIGENLTDGYYNFSIGAGNDIGYAPIEITIAEDLSGKKRDQLTTFADSYPTILILGIRDFNEKMKKELESLTDNTTYEVFKVLFPEDIIKYALILEASGSLQFLRKIGNIDESIKTFLKKFATNYYNLWQSTFIGKKKVREKTKKEGTIAIPSTEKGEYKVQLTDIQERLIKAFIGELNSQNFEEKTRKKIESLERVLSKRINNILGVLRLSKFTNSEIKGVIQDILHKWTESNLGESTASYFKPYNKRNRPGNPTWNTETAAKVAVSEILPRIVDKNKDKIDTVSLKPLY